MIHNLIQIIGREAKLFESFLSVLEEQQEMLVANNLKGINKTTAAQRELLIESQILNKEREELTEKIKSDNAIKGDLNVSRLLEMVDKNQAEQLIKLKNIIFGLHEQINEVRNQNANLLNRSRDYIARMMEMLARVNTPSGSYGSNGAQESKANPLAVDRRV